MQATALSMRERLEAVHGDILAVFAEENTLDTLLGDLGPKEVSEKTQEGRPRWPNRKLFAIL